MSNVTFDKSEFLAKIKYSLGLAETLPNPQRGCRLSVRRNKERYVAFNETSLLEIRDDLLRNLQGHDVCASARIVGTIKSVAQRFHWMLLPHYDEILAWYDEKKMETILRAVKRWKAFGGEYSMFIDRDEKRNDRLAMTAMIVVSELFSTLPEYSFFQALQSN